MRRMLRNVNWKTWISFSIALMVVFIVLDRNRLAEANEKLVEQSEISEREDAAARAKMLAGQRKLQAQVNRLASQNAALVELNESQGVRVPPSLIGGRETVRTETIERDSDDGDTTIVVPQPRSTQNPRPSPTSPPARDEGTRVDVPDIPLPDQAGRATDTAKDIVDDVTGIKLD